jgi:hypothetical protein
MQQWCPARQQATLKHKIQAEQVKSRGGAHQAVKTTAAVLLTKVPAGAASQLVPAMEL